MALRTRVHERFAQPTVEAGTPGSRPGTPPGATILSSTPDPLHRRHDYSIVGSVASVAAEKIDAGLKKAPAG
ncbi:MAG TPA: hypothetical protein VIK32_12040, partial [Candidatus Limnocylindrales bacterium]